MDETTRMMLSSPLKHLFEETVELKNFALQGGTTRRYFESLVFNISDEEITGYSELYRKTIKELEERPALPGLPLTSKKVSEIIARFPVFEREHYQLFPPQSPARGLLHLLLSPVLKFTRTLRFTREMDEIERTCNDLLNLYNTDNMEAWLEMQEGKK